MEVVAHNHGTQPEPIEEVGNEEEEIFKMARINLHETSKLIKTYGVEILEKKDKDGFSVLHWAAFGGNLNTVALVLSKGQTLDVECLFYLNEDGDSVPKYDPFPYSNNATGSHPLHWACDNGRSPIVELFLKMGIDIDIRDAKQNTPLMIAVQNNHTLLSFFLHSKGADITAVDREGDNCLHWASYKGNIKLVEYFLSHNLDAGLKDSVGQTPLHLASLSGNIDVIKALIVHNPNFMEADRNGRNCLQLAAGRNHVKLVEFYNMLGSKNDEELKVTLHDLSKYSEVHPDSNDTLATNKQHLFYFYNTLFIINYALMCYLFFVGTYHNLNLGTLIHLTSLAVLFYIYAKIHMLSSDFILSDEEQYNFVLSKLNSGSDISAIAMEAENLCERCKLVKPENTYHCSSCNRCVYNSESHDFLFGKCISRKTNYLYTMYFVFFGVSALYGLIRVHFAYLPRIFFIYNIIFIGTIIYATIYTIFKLIIVGYDMSTTEFVNNSWFFNKRAVCKPSYERKFFSLKRTLKFLIGRH